MAFDFKGIFQSSSQTQPTPSLGVNLGAKNAVGAELEDVTKTIKNTSRKYTTEITKYKEIAAFNKKLSESYVQNLQAMVDVSRLLEQYAHVFYVLREEIEKMEKALGIELNVKDFQYLENMTKDHMLDLTNKFNKESDDLKKLFEKYGKKDEYNHVDNAQKLMNLSVTNAGDTYKKLVEIERQNQAAQQQDGGLSKKDLSTTRVIQGKPYHGNQQRQRNKTEKNRSAKGSTVAKRTTKRG